MEQAGRGVKLYSNSLHPTLYIYLIIKQSDIVFLNIYQFTREKIKMKLMNGEYIISESDNKDIVLTTHRVRYSIKRGGTARVTSIMLEELDSCELRSISSPSLLVVAAIVVLGGFVIGSNYIVYGLLAALPFVIFYYFSRNQVISLKSSSSEINVQTVGMSLEVSKSFIDTVEAAKHSRYLLGHHSSPVGNN